MLIHIIEKYCNWADAILYSETILSDNGEIFSLDSTKRKICNMLIIFILALVEENSIFIKLIKTSSINLNIIICQFSRLTSHLYNFVENNN